MTATFTEPAPASDLGRGDEPADYGTLPELPPADVPPDSKPKGRPTTRAGRLAAKKARQASAASDDSKPRAARTSSAPRKASLEKRLTASLCSVGGMVAGLSAVTGSQPLAADGLVIIQQSADMAEAINRLAEEDPRIKAGLEKMLSAGAWSGVMAAVLPVVLAIGGNHGLIPPQLAAMFATVPQSEPAAA
jgi:hypothetical protein